MARLDTVVKTFFNHRLIEVRPDDLRVVRLSPSGHQENITNEGTLVTEGPYLAWLPAKPLEPGATYTVRVDEKVVSEVGDTLDDDPDIDESHVFSFRAVSHNTTTLGNNLVSQENTTAEVAYRVQGGPACDQSRHRLSLDNGSVSIDEAGGQLFINFADEHRALQFLLKRAEHSLSRDELPSVFNFRVKRSCVDEMRQLAVPQKSGRKYPDRAQIVDYNHGRDQFGIPKVLWEPLLNCVVSGSAGMTDIFDPRWDKPEHASLHGLLQEVRLRVAE
jgi:hypothetical protein